MRLRNGVPEERICIWNAFQLMIWFERVLLRVVKFDIAESDISTGIPPLRAKSYEESAYKLYRGLPKIGSFYLR